MSSIDFLLNPSNSNVDVAPLGWSSSPTSLSHQPNLEKIAQNFPPYTQHEQPSVHSPKSIKRMSPPQQQRNHHLPSPRSAPQSPHNNNNTSSSLKGNIRKTEKKKGNMKEMVLEEKYLRMKQSDAAFHLGFAATTFSKRWRASLPKRKWPFRKHIKLLNTIKDLKSMQQRGQDVQAYMGKLLREKKENLLPAVVHYYEKDIVTRSRGYEDYEEEEGGGQDIGDYDGDSSEENVFAPNE